MQKQFTMSMFLNEKELYKAKSEYLLEQIKEVQKAITDLEQSWTEMKKFGSHEGDCDNTHECDKCGSKLMSCVTHQKHMKMRMEDMERNLQRLRAFKSDFQS